MEWCPIHGHACVLDCAWRSGSGCGLICALDDIAGELEKLNAALSTDDEQQEP